MTFYLITSREEKSYRYLKNSAEKRGVKVVKLTNQKELEEASPLSSYDLVYRVGVGEHMRNLEPICILKGATPLAEPVRHTIQWSTEASEFQGTQYVPHRRILQYDEDLIKQFVNELGGCPVVLKIMGYAHGEGVSRYYSEQELKKALYQIDFTNQTVYLKRYIEADGHIRVAVLGGGVLGAIKYLKPSNDFRTNLKNNVTVEPIVLTSEQASVAIRAIHNENHVFGGVDLIIDQNGIPYVMEVNIPCFFPRVQDALDVDISGEIVDYLIRKVLS